MNASSPYPVWLNIHFFSVVASIGLFSLRGMAVLLQQQWPKRPFWRITSVLIDIVLLSAGIMLWWSFSHNPFHEPWLAVKLILLPLYVALGTMVLKKARSTTSIALFYLCALGCAGYMFMTGLTRNALWWMA